MSKTTTTPFDISEHLRTPEEMAAYLEACIEEAGSDAAFVAKALGDIARAKGMSEVARETGLSRESLYKALSGERNPSFGTILQVVRALGLRLHADAALPRRIAGDLRGDRRRRHEGVCVKHLKGKNSVKVYNKAGNVLRTETTINDTRAFQVFRSPEDDEKRGTRWLPMRKAVADLQRRARLSQASNERYLNALASCPKDATYHEVVGEVGKRLRHKGRPVRALNPSAAHDLDLLHFLNQGQWAIEGLRNRDLALWLEPQASQWPPDERRKLTGRVSRLRFILKAHGLIRKVGKTHRYMVTSKGHRVAALTQATATIQAQQLMDNAA